jgi:hypothetical protein
MADVGQRHAMGGPAAIGSPRPADLRPSIKRVVRHSVMRRPSWRDVSSSLLAAVAMLALSAVLVLIAVFF